MRRGAKRARTSGKAKLPAARKSEKADASRGRLAKRLAEAREQQAATSEILRAISSSQTDLQPVFDAIVRSAVRLCGADNSVAARFDGELLHPLAYHGFSPEALEFAASSFPMRPTMENMLGRAALTPSTSIEFCAARSAGEAASSSRCCGKGLPSVSSRWRVPRLGRSPIARSNY